VPRHAYVQALILQRLGRAPEAIAVLETLVARHPTDRDGLLALATFARDAGETARARRAAAALLALDPGDRQAAALLGQLGGARP
jgi:predicted Zn-dependent protease